MKEIYNLKPKKAMRDADIPVKILQLNHAFFAGYICSQFNRLFLLRSFRKVFNVVFLKVSERNIVFY